MTTPNRPSASKRWPHTCSMKLTPSHIESGITNMRGSTNNKNLAGKKATVILGKKKSVGGIVTIGPDDQVWTVVFSGRGLMSSIGVPGAEITILIE